MAKIITMLPFGSNPIFILCTLQRNKGIPYNIQVFATWILFKGGILWLEAYYFSNVKTNLSTHLMTGECVWITHRTISPLAYWTPRDF